MAVPETHTAADKQLVSDYGLILLPYVDLKHLDLEIKCIIKQHTHVVYTCRLRNTYLSATPTSFETSGTFFFDFYGPYLGSVGVKNHPESWGFVQFS